MTARLTYYKGALSPTQAADGIALARRNATRLIADAELLLESDRNPSSAALAILAIEELGKVQVIKRIVLQLDSNDLKKAWKDYRSHSAKNVMWILPQLVAEGARTMLQLRPATEIDGEHTKILDSVKQLSFYTDCFNDKPRWSDPVEAVDGALAESVIATAKILNQVEEITVRELELWVHHVRPHFDKQTMPQAVINYQKSLFEEGLSKTRPEKLEAFMRGRPVAVEPEVDN
jgi:AbiV family abortive infection protein